MTYYNEINVYIAAPFFKPEQLEMVKGIENILEKYRINYFSPRKEGVIKEMNAEEKKRYMKGIYDSNISEMEKANFMIAVIDDYDTGTVFELGYFTFMKGHGVKEAPDHFLAEHSVSPRVLKNISIVTLTGKGYELNVMLKFGTDCHLKGLESLEFLLADIYKHGINDKTLTQHSDCPPVFT